MSSLVKNTRFQDQKHMEIQQLVLITCTKDFAMQ